MAVTCKDSTRELKPRHHYRHDSLPQGRRPGSDRKYSLSKNTEKIWKSPSKLALLSSYHPIHFQKRNESISISKIIDTTYLLILDVPLDPFLSQTT